MNTKRILGVAAALVLVGLTAGSASATITQPADGDTHLNLPDVNGVGNTFGHHVRATNVGGIAFGSIITCNTSVVSGYIDDNDPLHPGDAGWDAFHSPAIDGGSGDIAAASFTNCGFGNSITVNNLPWQMNAHPIDNDTNLTHVSGADLTAVLIGSVTCRYTGWMSGTHEEVPGTVVLSGVLTKVSGSALCGATEYITGTYSLRVDADNDADNDAVTNPVGLRLFPN